MQLHCTIYTLFCTIANYANTRIKLFLIEMISVFTFIWLWISAKMESRFWGRPSHYILMKDYKGKQFVFGKFGTAFTDESRTIRPGMCIRKVNRANFDFMLIWRNNLEIGLSPIRTSLPFLERVAFLVWSVSRVEAGMCQDAITVHFWRVLG